MATCCALCNHGVLTLLNDSLSAPLSVVGGLRSIVVYLDSDFDPNRTIFHPLLNVFASASTHLYVACSDVNNGPVTIGFLGNPRVTKSARRRALYNAELRRILSLRFRWDLILMGTGTPVTSVFAPRRFETNSGISVESRGPLKQMCDSGRRFQALLHVERRVRWVGSRLLL